MGADGKHKNVCRTALDGLLPGVEGVIILLCHPLDMPT
jgi:hypothetical protein